MLKAVAGSAPFGFSISFGLFFHFHNHFQNRDSRSMLFNWHSSGQMSTTRSQCIPFCWVAHADRRCSKSSGTLKRLAKISFSIHVTFWLPRQKSGPIGIHRKPQCLYIPENRRYRAPNVKFAITPTSEAKVFHNMVAVSSVCDIAALPTTRRRLFIHSFSTYFWRFSYECFYSSTQGLRPDQARLRSTDAQSNHSICMKVLFKPLHSIYKRMQEWNVSFLFLLLPILLFSCVYLWNSLLAEYFHCHTHIYMELRSLTERQYRQAAETAWTHGYAGGMNPMAYEGPRQRYFYGMYDSEGYFVGCACVSRKDTRHTGVLKIHIFWVHPQGRGILDLFLCTLSFSSRPLQFHL